MRRFVTRSLAVLLLAVLVIGPIALHVGARDAWTCVTTANFEVIGDARPERIRLLAGRLEQFRAAVGRLLPTVKLRSPVPSLVVLFRDDGSFRPYKPRAAGKIRENVGGYFERDLDANVMALPDEGGSFDSALRTLLHEYTHFVMNNNVPNMPAWLDEGLAEYYSTFRMDDDGITGSLGEPLAGRLSLLREEKALPIERLLAVDRGSVEYTDRKMAPLFYAQSWALVHYLVLGEGGVRKATLEAYIESLATGSSGPDAFHKAFGGDLKPLEEGLARYIRRKPLPTLNFTFRTPLDSAQAAGSRPMPDAEVAARLAQLSLLVGQVADAERHAGRAFAAAPSDPLVLETAAKIRLARDDPEGVIRTLDPVVSRPDASWVSLALSGEAHLRLGDGAMAVRLLRAAVERKGDLARIHSALGIACAMVGEDGAAVSAFAAASQLEPGDVTILLNRAHAFSRLAMWDRAAHDAGEYLRLEGWENTSAPYMALVAYFSRRFAGDAGGADRVLDDAARRLTAGKWPEPVFAFLQKRTTEEDLLRAASGVDEQTEAYAYAGLVRLSRGDRAGARELLGWVAANGNPAFTEYAWAQAELRRMHESVPDAPSR